jgi:hypothetical protein
MSWKCGSISLGTPIIIKKGSIKAIVVVKEGVFFPAIMIKKREHTIGYNQLESSIKGEHYCISSLTLK